jgi:hypothetical protein
VASPVAKPWACPRLGHRAGHPRPKFYCWTVRGPRVASPVAKPWACPRLGHRAGHPRPKFYFDVYIIFKSLEDNICSSSLRYIT